MKSKGTQVVIASLALGASLFAGLVARAEVVRQNERLPFWTYVRSDGTRLNLEESARGSVSIVYLRKRSCGPCDARLADLRSVASDLGEKFLVMDLLLESPSSDAVEGDERIRRGFDFDQKWERAIAAPALPHALILDREGVVRFIQSGEAAMRADILKEKMRALAEGRRPRLRSEAALARSSEDGLNREHRPSEPD